MTQESVDPEGYPTGTFAPWRQPLSTVVLAIAEDGNCHPYFGANESLHTTDVSLMTSEPLNVPGAQPLAALRRAQYRELCPPAGDVRAARGSAP